MTESQRHTGSSTSLLPAEHTARTTKCRIEYYSVCGQSLHVTKCWRMAEQVGLGILTVLSRPAGYIRALRQEGCYSEHSVSDAALEAAFYTRRGDHGSCVSHRLLWWGFGTYELSGRNRTASAFVNLPGKTVCELKSGIHHSPLFSLPVFFSTA